MFSPLPRSQRVYSSRVATMDDLDALALRLPDTTKEVSDEGRPAYLVHGKMFCCHRSRRKDAIDAVTGERLDDVLLFHVLELEVKDVLLDDPREVFFTTPHFRNYPAILLRIPRLAELGRDELGDLVADAWLSRAPKRVANAWIKEQDAAE
jgi:hypothetical protein